MKQIKKLLAIVLASVLSIAMIPTINVNAARVKLNKKQVTIYVGKTVTLKLKNNKKKVKWISSNKKVATVSKKGKVKGKKAGKATIIAKVGKKKYKCKLTVKKIKKKTNPAEKTAPHNHNFVDDGVISLDWTYANNEPDYTGPTSTTEKVNAINACVECGYYFGDESDMFADRYYDHIWGPNSADCGGAYSLRTVYARYHLLECSCGAYRRGKLAYYEYLMYFNGNGQLPTRFILEDWQIQELGLPMP